jgi:uncharacterized membrane protein
MANSTTQARFGTAVLERLISLCILYVTLAFVLILVLGAVAQAEPRIINFLATQQDTLGFMTAAEAAHMTDVANLLQGGMLIALAAVLVIVFYTQYQPISRTIVRDAFIMSLVLIALLIPFNYTFVWFHHAFFPQGNWQFSADSWLITHFPEKFFALWGLMWIGGTTLLLGIFTRVVKK